MVKLPKESKIKIMTLLLDDTPRIEVANKMCTSLSTISRVVKEYKNGVFLMDTPTEAANDDNFSDALDAALQDVSLEDMRDDIEDIINNVVNDVSNELVNELLNEFNYVITPVNVAFTVGDDSYTADITHPSYKDIVAAVIENDPDTAIELIDIAKTITEFMLGHIEVKGGVVYYEGQVVHGNIVTRILESMENNDEYMVTAYVSFLNNLMKNPSNTSVEDAYDFIVANDIKITEDGHILTWKRVSKNFTDIFTGEMDNSVGQVVKMRRNMVNEDNKVTCSHGLHVCSKSYLPHYGAACGNKIVMCKVNPRDIVAVPKDYNNVKMRVCQYEVVADMTGKV